MSDPLGQLRFLLGNWKGRSENQFGGKGVIESRFVFTQDPSEHFIMERDESWKEGKLVNRSVSFLMWEPNIGKYATMETRKLQLLDNHRNFIDRFTAACQADERVLAAFLGGSYAKGRADVFSDLDLTLITTDASYEQFVAGREAFIRQLGEPLFIEDFGLPNIVFMIFSDGTEAELWFASASHLEHIQSGPFHILLDKTGILACADFPPSQADPAVQTEKLHRLIYWFWHDLSHFITAIGRGQLWWARGQLDVLRGICVNLARLKRNFSDGGVGEEPYFKLEDVVSPRDLSPLQATFCPIERESMLQSAQAILQFYKEVAPPLAQAHGVPYRAELERVMTQRLWKLTAARLQS